MAYAITVLGVYLGKVWVTLPGEVAALLRLEARAGDRPDVEQALARLEEVFPEVRGGT